MWFQLNIPVCILCGHIAPFVPRGIFFLLGRYFKTKDKSDDTCVWKSDEMCCPWCPGWLYVSSDAGEVPQSMTSACAPFFVLLQLLSKIKARAPVSISSVFAPPVFPSTDGTTGSGESASEAAMTQDTASQDQTIRVQDTTASEENERTQGDTLAQGGDKESANNEPDTLQKDPSKAWGTQPKGPSGTEGRDDWGGSWVLCGGGEDATREEEDGKGDENDRTRVFDYKGDKDGMELMPLKSHEGREQDSGASESGESPPEDQQKEKEEGVRGGQEQGRHLNIPSLAGKLSGARYLDGGVAGFTSDRAGKKSRKNFACKRRASVDESEGGDSHTLSEGYLSEQEQIMERLLDRKEGILERRCRTQAKRNDKRPRKERAKVWRKESINDDAFEKFLEYNERRASVGSSSGSSSSGSALTPRKRRELFRKQRAQNQALVDDKETPPSSAEVSGGTMCPRPSKEDEQSLLPPGKQLEEEEEKRLHETRGDDSKKKNGGARKAEPSPKGETVDTRGSADSGDNKKAGKREGESKSTRLVASVTTTARGKTKQDKKAKLSKHQKLAAATRGAGILERPSSGGSLSSPEERSPKKSPSSLPPSFESRAGPSPLLPVAGVTEEKPQKSDKKSSQAFSSGQTTDAEQAAPTKKRSDEAKQKKRKEPKAGRRLRRGSTNSEASGADQKPEETTKTGDEIPPLHQTTSKEGAGPVVEKAAPGKSKSEDSLALEQVGQPSTTGEKSRNTTVSPEATPRGGKRKGESKEKKSGKGRGHRGQAGEVAATVARIELPPVDPVESDSQPRRVEPSKKTKLELAAKPRGSSAQVTVSERLKNLQVKFSRLEKDQEEGMRSSVVRSDNKAPSDDTPRKSPCSTDRSGSSTSLSSSQSLPESFAEESGGKQAPSPRKKGSSKPSKKGTKKCRGV